MSKKDKGLIDTFVTIVRNKDNSGHHGFNYHVGHFNKGNILTLTTNHGLEDVLKLNHISKQIIYNNKDNNALEIAKILEKESWNITVGETSTLTEGEY